jgi:cysteine desulfurase
VDRFGQVDPEDVRRALRPETAIVSIMAANNEIGTLQPLAAVAAVLEESGVPFHSDAAQAAGRVGLDLGAMGPGLISLSAHKLHGPKGVGALVLRSDLAARIEPRTFGGGQERGLRPGTQNVAGIVGFGAAAGIATEGGEDERARLASLRDRLLAALMDCLDGIEVNGHPTERLPNNLHFSIDGVDGESLATALADEVAVSTGSACASAKGGSSHVLQAIGLPPGKARGSIRIGLGRFNTEDEIDRAGARIVEEARRLRALGSWDPSRAGRS